MRDMRCGVWRRIVISGVMLCAMFSASARTRPHYGGTLRVEIRGDAWSVDGLARRLVLNTLTSLDREGAARPALALNWDEENNDQRWDFKLRPDVQFQDGSPLTADAVVASLSASCLVRENTGTIAGKVLPDCPWNSLRANGASDVEMTTDHPAPDFPELLAQSRFAISKKDAAGTILGTGPFKVAGVSEDVLTLSANGSCWQGRPYLDSLEIVQHRSIRAQWMDLTVGRADVVQVPPEMLPEAQDRHLNLLVSRPVDLLALTIAPQGRFSGENMRQAAALAVDRDALHDVIYQKQGEISASLLPEWLSGYSFLFSTARDLSKARVLRGGVPPEQIWLASEMGGAIEQLAASRLALNLNEAGFDVRMAAPGTRTTLELRKIHLDEMAPRAALDATLNSFGESVTVKAANAEALWSAEQQVLQRSTVVPLIWLPRAWAYDGRVRDLQLSDDGEPMLANASLEGAK